MGRPRTSGSLGVSPTSATDGNSLRSTGSMFNLARRRQRNPQRDDSLGDQSPTLVPLETRYHGFDRRGPAASPLRKNSHLADAAEKLVAQQATCPEASEEVDMVVKGPNGKPLLVLEAGRTTAAKAWVGGVDHRSGGVFTRKSTGSLAQSGGTSSSELIVSQSLSEGGVVLSDRQQASLRRSPLQPALHYEMSDDDIQVPPASVPRTSEESTGSITSISSIWDSRASLGSHMSETTESSSCCMDTAAEQEKPSQKDSADEPAQSLRGSKRMGGIFRHWSPTANVKALENDNAPHERVLSRPRNEVPKHRSSFRGLVMVDGLPSIATDGSWASCELTQSAQVPENCKNNQGVPRKKSMSRIGSFKWNRMQR